MAEKPLNAYQRWRIDMGFDTPSGKWLFRALVATAAYILVSLYRGHGDDLFTITAALVCWGGFIATHDWS